MTVTDRGDDAIPVYEPWKLWAGLAAVVIVAGVLCCIMFLVGSRTSRDAADLPAIPLAHRGSQVPVSSDGRPVVEAQPMPEEKAKPAASLPMPEPTSRADGTVDL